MSENRQINSNLRNALSNLAQEARNLLDNYDDISSSAIERQLLHSTPTTNKQHRTCPRKRQRDECAKHSGCKF